MLPTHPVPCPRCGKAMYWAVSLEDAVDAGAVESPRVDHDLKGYYTICPHCAERVPMERMTEAAAEAWRPAR